MVTGAAHFAVGAAAYAVTQDWRVAGAVAVLSHPVLDLAGAYHPPQMFDLDTWQKKVLIYANFWAFVALILSTRTAAGFAALGFGALAWGWADVWWIVREFWPRLDRFNPHRLWWVRGWEHRELMWGFWLEVAVIAAATTVAVWRW